MNNLEAIKTHLALHNIRHAETLRDELDDLQHIRQANILLRDARRLDPREKRARVQLPVVLLSEEIGALVGISFGTEEPPDKRLDNSLLEALDKGVQAAWALVRPEPSLPPPVLLPRVELDAACRHELGGQSAGLAAALAAFGAMTGKAPACTVIASGEIDDSGALLAASQLTPKLEATSREGWNDALVLLAGRRPAEMPSGLDVHTVDTVEQAIRLAYGQDASSFEIAGGLLDGKSSRKSLINLLADGQFERVIHLAERLAGKMKPGIHSLRVSWLAARAAVHLGIEDAQKRYDRIEQAIHQRVENRELSHDDWAKFVADSTVALIDQREYEEAEARLRRALREGTEIRPITKDAEIHVRGTLAMALAHQGRDRQAVEERRRNLELHDFEAGDQSTLARTHCNLAWELYRANGDARESLQQLDQADALANSKNNNQALYNLYARARILLWSRQPEQVSESIRKAARIDGMEGLLAGIDQYPACCIELVRCAALVKAGLHLEGLERLEHLRAANLAAGRPRRGLVGWLLHLGLGWEIAAHQGLGDPAGTKTKAGLARDLLHPESPQCLHPPSGTRFSSIAPLPSSPTGTGDTVRSWHMRCWY